MESDNERDKLLTNIYQRIQKDESVERLSNEQLHFILHPLDQSSFLSACPGSGKTEVVGYKTAYEIKGWTCKYSGLAVLTFTNNAAGEIKERASKYSNQKANSFPHFIGTLDSWLHGYIFQPFGHSVMNYKGDRGDRSINIIESDSNAPFLTNYLITRNNAKPIPVQHYCINADGKVSIVKGAHNFEPLEEERLLNEKEKFASNGFATYEDAEYWAIHLLKKPDIVKLVSKRFPVIIIDECQDLSPVQLELISMLQAEGTKFHFVGDLNQAIYEFRKVDPNLIKAHVRDTQMIEMKLTKNYRSIQCIVDICSSIMGTNSIKGRNNFKEDSCQIWEYAKDDIGKLPDYFQEYITEENLDCDKSAILVRGKALLGQFRGTGAEFQANTAEKIAKALTLWQNRHAHVTYIQDALQLLGESLTHLAFDGRGNHQNQYCPVCFNHVGWRKILKKVLITSEKIALFNENGTPISWTKWISQQLKPFLESHWTLLSLEAEGWEKAKAKIISPSGKKDELVSESISIPECSKCKIKITTIHSAKGETYEAVMLVSSKTKQSPGGHIDHWFTGEKNENNRFAYVACSRPRNILILAVPPLKQADQEKFKSMGFIYKKLNFNTKYDGR
ncbi:ATP-dependent helicase [Anaerospora hongkongensis]|uniref:ATP-dependent helicase n=1 Tax=Anaerospora hongkongensis TaxID=244830 RepID=UPI0028A1C8B4|nr:ATP-dependent helicase [Anaerospora hongkongensis]